MQISNLNDIQPDGRGLCARQSRLAGLLFGLLMIAMFAASPVVLWYQGAPPLFVFVFAMAGLCVILLLVGDLRARLRRTNWLLWLAPEGVWINLRSYQATHLTDPPTVVFLEYSDLAAAGQRTFSTITRRKNGRGTYHRDSTLELRLTDSDVTGLQRAINDEHALATQPQTLLGGVTVSNRTCIPPLSAPEPGLIRILWRTGRGQFASPSLKRVLAELELHGVEIAEPITIKAGEPSTKSHHLATSSLA